MKDRLRTLTLCLLAAVAIIATVMAAPLDVETGKLWTSLRV